MQICFKKGEVLSRTFNMLELQPHMGHQDQDGEKVGQMSFFFKSQRLLRTEKSKNSYTFKSYYLILASGVLKIWVSGFGRNLGCVRYAQSWVFFQNFQNPAFLLLYYSASKKARTMVFIWGDRGYPAVCFEYKTASGQYSVAEI